MKKTMMLAAMMLTVGAVAQATELKSGTRVFVEDGLTVDSSNAKNKANYADFGLVLTAALQKKHVPVVIVTDRDKADFIIRHSSTMQTDSTGARIAKMAFGFGYGGRNGQFEGSVNVIDRESTAVVYAFNTKKGKAQAGAENFAGKFGKLFHH